MIPSKLRWTIVSAAVVAGLLILGRGPVPAQAAPNDEDPARVFVGYLFAAPRNINFRLYTHLCHAFLVADGEGRIQKRGNVPNRDLTTDSHKAGVKVLLSLGGWGWDKQFASIVSKPESEDRYFQGVMEVVDQFDYDGIDLDWEYPDTKEEVVGFERLTRRFRKALDDLGQKKGRHMFVTFAASSNPGTVRWLDKAFVLETMDWINVMTYDYTGEWTKYAGHQSPLFASSKQPGNPRSTELSMKYLLEERGLPASRLAVGIPLYGRGFNVDKPYASTEGAPKRRLPRGDYANLHKLESSPDWNRQWDDQTKNPWLVSKKDPAVIGYDDPRSVGLKTEWAMKQGFRGVFFWQVHGDRLPDGTNPLQEASHREWEKAAGKGR